MKIRIYILAVFYISFLSAEQKIKHTFSTESRYTNYEMEDDSFDIDEMTELMIESGLDKEINVKPPSVIMVWLRKMGMPIAVKLARIYQSCSDAYRRFTSYVFIQK